jgi:hypothetical protein
MNPSPVGEPETGPIPKPPRRIVVSGSDLKPRLYQAHEQHPTRDRALLVGKAIFIVILVWLLAVAFLSTGEVQHIQHLVVPS